MNSYRDGLWILLGEWIDNAELGCVEYDSPLTFVREKFFDYILLTIHYTNSSDYGWFRLCNFVFGTCYPVAIKLTLLHCLHISTIGVKYILQFKEFSIKYTIIRKVHNIYVNI